MNKNIKYLIEDIVNFNPAEYKDDENSLLGQDEIYSVLKTPINLNQLKILIRQKINENPENPYLKDIDTSLINSMYNLFSGDEFADIKILDLSAWDTSNVKNMACMFKNLTNLEKIKLSPKFDTSNVKTMRMMFYNCQSLQSPDLSNFNTVNVRDMSQMFEKCICLTDLDLLNFNTSKVTNMENMFSYCALLNTLDLSSFNTSNVTNMHQMFYKCLTITKLDLSNFNVSKVRNICAMFSHCYKLTFINLSNFNIQPCIEREQICNNCFALKQVIAPKNTDLRKAIRVSVYHTIKIKNPN